MTREQVIADYMDRIRGRLCGLIESFGLPERQERACIQTLKSISYDLQRELEQMDLENLDQPSHN